LGVLLALLGSAGVGGYLWLNAPQRVTLQVEPEPGEITIDGELEPYGGKPLSLPPGTYQIGAAVPGHAPLEETIEVRRDAANRFRFELEPLDGVLTILTNVEDAEVLIDGEPVTGTDKAFIELPAGEYTVRVEAGEAYLPFEKTVTVAGKRAETLVEADLKPNWGYVQVRTEPQGARIFNAASGELLATTPANLKLLSGDYQLRVQPGGADYAAWTPEVRVRPGSNIDLGFHRFQLRPGELTLETEPAGASVLVNGRAAEGLTPLTAEIPPGVQTTVRLLAEGYAEAALTIQLEPDGQAVRTVSLSPVSAPVRIVSEPQLAEVFGEDGQSLGLTPLTARLQTRGQVLTLRKEGFGTREVKLKPVAGREVTKRVKLDPLPGTPEARRKALMARASEAPARIEGPHGGTLVRIEPGSFTLGSPTDEPGRAPNEDPVKARLTLPFYVQATEVTNAQFRQFKPGHNSGRLGYHTLDTADRPVANVTWDEAAAFCNWLSAQAGLEPVYEQTAGGMRARSPLPAGYRLPTEAEFEYLLRLEAGPEPFPWGGFLPPPSGAGNFADEGNEGRFGGALRSYNDGFVASAPVSALKADKQGLRGLSGNLAEWCHDTYAPTFPGGGTLTDYAGPEPRAGGLRVVRGASYRDHSARALRSAYRGYAREAADDIGFRVVLPLGGYLTQSGTQ